MKNILGLILCFVSIVSSNAQYSISGQLDESHKNKVVYLSLLRFNEGRTISSAQMVSSTRTDSLGFYSFKGQLLSDKHALYRIHTLIEEKYGFMQLNDSEEMKNYHNFVFSNQDTIVFEQNNNFWFSDNRNSNPIDKEWQAFNSYSNKLQRELYTVTELNRDKSSSQALTEMKSYTEVKQIHPLVSLTLLGSIHPGIIKQDLKEDPDFYNKLKKNLSAYYGDTSYTLQFKELLTDLSKQETLEDLKFYKQSTYIFASLSILLLGSLISLYLYFERKKKTLLSENISLTKQEERIAELIVEGKSNKEIASDLFISLSTVKTHIRNLYAKMEVNNRSEFAEKFERSLKV